MFVMCCMYICFFLYDIVLCFVFLYDNGKCMGGCSWRYGWLVSFGKGVEFLVEILG